jgi:hypothetical protein
VRNFAIQANKKQPGDPIKLAKAFVALANADQPPVHLLLGNDAVEAYKEKMIHLEQDIATWYDVVTGTDHDDVKAQ